MVGTSNEMLWLLGVGKDIFGRKGFVAKVHLFSPSALPLWSRRERGSRIETSRWTVHIRQRFGRQHEGKKKKFLVTIALCFIFVLLHPMGLGDLHWIMPDCNRLNNDLPALFYLLLSCGWSAWYINPFLYICWPNFPQDAALRQKSEVFQKEFQN